MSELPPAEDEDVPDLSDLEERFPDLARLAMETDSDSGNAFRFARLCGSRIRYLTSDRTWLIWDGTRWVRDQHGSAMHLTLDVCRDLRDHTAHQTDDQAKNRWTRWAQMSESLGHRKAMLELATTLPKVAINAEDLDADPWLLNCPNGTVNLQTGEVQPHRREDLITHLTAEPYVREIIWSPPLLDFQTTFLPEDGEWDYLTRYLGTFLKGGNDLRVWTILHGPSTTGKTQLVEAIASVLGSYAVPVNTSVFRANLDDKPRPDLLRALSCRFAYAMEGSSSWELHGDHVKRLTGGDPIVARAMRSDMMVSRVPSFSPLIVCNSIPRITGPADTGVRRRLRVIPFDHSVVGMEDTRKRELFSTDPLTRVALLSQLIQGCLAAYTNLLALQEELPHRWEQATMNAFGQLTSVTDFLGYLQDQGQLIERANALIGTCWTATDLYLAYRTWVELYGATQERRELLGLKQFSLELRSMGWEATRSNGTRWLGKVRPEYVSNSTL